MESAESVIASPEAEFEQEERNLTKEELQEFTDLITRDQSDRLLRR